MVSSPFAYENTVFNAGITMAPAGGFESVNVDAWQNSCYSTLANCGRRDSGGLDEDAFCP